MNDFLHVTDDFVLNEAGLLDDIDDSGEPKSEGFGTNSGPRLLLPEKQHGLSLSAPSSACGQPGPEPSVNDHILNLCPTEYSEESLVPGSSLGSDNSLTPDEDSIHSTMTTSSSGTPALAKLQSYSQQAPSSSSHSVDAVPAARVAIPRATASHRCSVCGQAFVAAARLQYVTSQRLYFDMLSS